MTETMKTMQLRTNYWLPLLAALLLLAGCAAGPEATPLPTRTPAPTFTPTLPADAAPVVDAGQPAGEQPPAEQPPAEQPAADQPPAEAAPADTPTPEPTATTASAQVVLTTQTNIRGGPGTEYNLLGTENSGAQFRVTGKNPAGTWWEIDYNGRAGWVFGELVAVTGGEGVAVAANIPAAPVVPTAPPPPPAAPTNTPAPAQPAPTPAPAAPADNFPFGLLTTERCDPNPGQTYFSGYTRDANNNLINGVCVHIGFFGPRTTKCSGCDGVGDGNWGFSPFGGPAPRGTAVEIFVVACPGSLPLGGQSSDFTELVPQSPKWTRVINDSEQCTGITFYKK